jgi:hypothetical protein
VRPSSPFGIAFDFVPIFALFVPSWLRFGGEATA